MLTVEDIKKLVEVFSTRSEINQELEKIREEMATKEDLREVMTKVDAVFGEVKAMREEQVSHYLQHEDNDKEHIIFRKRLDKLEIAPVITHQIKAK
ncbi:MAG: hypothetical protein PHQ59_05580 [Candidatus Daviesbacteria bacterium]|nr:hypothetical protein [Candidatus Daviesbacteria bacterium]